MHTSMHVPERSTLRKNRCRGATLILTDPIDFGRCAPLREMRTPFGRPPSWAVNSVPEQLQYGQHGVSTDCVCSCAPPTPSVHLACAACVRCVSIGMRVDRELSDAEDLQAAINVAWVLLCTALVFWEQARHRLRPSACQPHHHHHLLLLHHNHLLFTTSTAAASSFHIATDARRPAP